MSGARSAAVVAAYAATTLLSDGVRAYRRGGTEETRVRNRREEHGRALPAPADPQAFGSPSQP